MTSLSPQMAANITAQERAAAHTWGITDYFKLMNKEHFDTVFVCSWPYREVSANTWLLQASSPSSQLSALLPLSSVQLTGALPRSRDTPLWQTHTYMLFASVRSLGWLMTNSSLVTWRWCSFMPGKQWAVMNNLTLVIIEVKLLLSGLVTIWYKTAQQDLSCKVTSAHSMLSTYIC